MPIADRSRSRLNPHSLSDYLRQATNPDIPHRAGHFRQHRSKPLIYTSSGSLSTTEGTPWVAPRTMRIVSISLNVAGAPSSTLTCDIWVDGASIFESSSSKPEIAASATASARKIYPDRTLVVAGSELSIKLTATGSATGPLIVTIEMRNEGA